MTVAPNEPGLWLNLGLPHLEQEDYAAAKLNVNDGAIYHQPASALQAAGRAAEAQQARAKVAALKQKAARDEREVFANR